MASDPHRVGTFRIGYSRIGVTEPVFENWMLAGITVKITRRRRVVSASSDLYTGHPNISWEAMVREVDAVITFGPAGSQDLAIGGLGQLDGVIKTADAMSHLDKFDYLGCRYEITSPPLEVRGRDGGFLYRKTAFRRVEFEEP